MDRARKCAVMLTLAVAACSWAGCPADDDAAPVASADAGSSDAATSNALPTESLVGDFEIKLVAGTPETEDEDAVAAHTLVVGIVKSAADPQAITWTEVDAAEGCKLVTPNAPAFCDPRCGGEAVCVSEDVCVATPTAQDLGTVAVSGVLADAISLKAIANKYQSPTLAYAPCAEGDVVSLAADGGAYTGFTLESHCIAPFDYTGSLLIEPGKPLSLKWAAASDLAQSRIVVSLDISHHGGTKGKILCEWDDDGAAQITGGLLDQLVALGYSGAPAISVSRVAVGHATTSEPSRVTLTVSSTVDRIVEIPGLVSCDSDDSQCPEGQTCQSDYQCK